MELNKQYLAKLRFREDTAQNWSISNPILSSSEPGREIDTGLIKVGDGKTPWKDLRPINESIKTINEPEANGKLYLRTRQVDSISGQWLELPVQEVPTSNLSYLREQGKWIEFNPNTKANKFTLNNKEYDLEDVYNSIPNVEDKNSLWYRIRYELRYIRSRWNI